MTETAKQGEPWAWADYDGKRVQGLFHGEPDPSLVFGKAVPLYPPSPAREALERLCEAADDIDGFVSERFAAALASAREQLGKEGA